MKIVTFGEIMLRLKSPGKERFFQSPMLEATFGGAEANVAAALAGLGMEAFYVTAVPDNPIGAACISELRKHGVNTSFMLKTGKRLGIYFLEPGASQRASVVVYDRENSSFAQTHAEKYEWEKIFENASWFHISGVTPALCENTKDAVFYAVSCAKKAGAVISCDLNYRSKLWKYGKKAPEVMSRLMKFADIVAGNEEDCQKSLGIDTDFYVEKGEFDEDRYKKITAAVLETYPNIKKIALTLRKSISADVNGWSAVLNTRGDYIKSQRYEISSIVDRLGSGDAFAGGLIYGFNKFKTDKEALEFAVALSSLKHSVPGDFSLASEAEVMDILKSGGSGRIQR